MGNELALKVYEVDYDFISKNCLKPELWNKTWTLFVYRNYIFELEISSINVKENTISFCIIGKKGCKSHSTYVWFHRNTENYNVLKKQVNGAIFELIRRFEGDMIEYSDTYCEISNSRSSEYDMLREIAENFLDDNGVSNSEIRDIYIDNYIDNHSRIDSDLQSYRLAKEYCVLSELYLVFTKAIKDDNRYNIVLNKISRQMDYEEKIKDIMDELKEYVEKIDNQDQDLIDELTNDLESL